MGLFSLTPFQFGRSSLPFLDFLFLVGRSLLSLSWFLVSLLLSRLGRLSSLPLLAPLPYWLGGSSWLFGMPLPCWSGGGPRLMHVARSSFPFLFGRSPLSLLGCLPPPFLVGDPSTPLLVLCLLLLPCWGLSSLVVGAVSRWGVGGWVGGWGGGGGGGTDCVLHKSV